jgi:murein DD-endopeptidase MepM/ murein hydrolase activator NlpD
MENCKLIIVYFFLILILSIIIIGVVNNRHQKEIENKEVYIDSLLHTLHVKTFESTNPLQAIPLGAPLDTVKVSSPFGVRRNPISKRWQRHQGIDLKGTYLDTVYATGDGVVLHSGWCGGYGRCIEIYHGWEYQSTYAHLNKVFVKEEDTICDGQPIGTVGNTGSSTGQHLHYEISLRGKKIDPFSYVYTEFN